MSKSKFSWKQTRVQHHFCRIGAVYERINPATPVSSSNGFDEPVDAINEEMHARPTPQKRAEIMHLSFFNKALWHFALVVLAWVNICSVKAATLLDLNREMRQSRQGSSRGRVMVTSDVMFWSSEQHFSFLWNFLTGCEKQNGYLPVSCCPPSALWWMRFCVLNILFRLDSLCSESLTPVLACVSVRKDTFLSGFALTESTHQWQWLDF